VQSQPPPALPKNKQPFLRLLMPAVMLVAVLGMVAVMVLSGMGRSPMSFIFPLMMLGSMAMMFQPGGQDVDDIRRSFHRHLDALSDSLRRTRADQLERAAQTNPDPAALWTWAAEGVDSDPGVVRIGTAVQAPEEALDVPVEGPPEDLEPVCAMGLRDLALRSATLEAPVAVDLREFPCVAVTGPGSAGLVRAMQGQLALQDMSAVSIEGPHDRWLGHHGPLRVRFVHGRDAATGPSDTGPAVTVVAHPDGDATELARARGLLLRAGDGDGGLLAAWTVDGWRDFGTADHLSDAELGMVCRARSRTTGSTSLLDLPGGGLRAPVSTGPAPVYLDIRESAKGGIGPHGLCIGATGSGKSELLRTIVTSFAHQHSPDDLNFILIDFKGGAAFAGMERLAHTSAVITNLSEEAVLVDRMQDSLLGEMHRRQEKLRAAGLTTATDFNRAHRGAMPSLFIIVDEFSELLHARPEFAEVFAAVGRLGRSLGMHLLLASQRLEEGRLRGLESHLSYRIALRTFSAVESRALIGTTEAYDLPASPGAAILAEASGAEGARTRFQAAYVSGPEMPADRRLIRELGTVAEAAGTTTDLVVDRLAGPNRNPVWLPPLPAELAASEMLGGSPEQRTVPVTVPLTVPLGLEDLPFDGVQRPFVLDLRRRHWAVVGAPGTGKTTAVRSLVIGLALGSPGVAVYVIDPGGSLADLQRLPQVAAVVKVDLLDRVLDELEQVPPAPGVPGHAPAHRVLVVDGLDAVGEADRRLAALAAGGLERGVHVVVTAQRWTFRPSLKDLLGGHVELRMSPSDADFRDVQRILPDLPGRGVSPGGKQLQVALSTPQDTEHARRVSVARGEPERRLRVLPELVRLSELSELSELGSGRAASGVRLGVGGPSLGTVTWDPGKLPHLTVVGQARSGVTTALRTVIASIGAGTGTGAGAEGAGETVVLASDARRGLLGAPGYRSPAGFTEEVDRWVGTLTERIPGDAASLTPQMLRDRSWWSGPDVVVVVDDLDHSADLASAVDRLVPLLPHAADIGLHLVTGRRSAAMTRSSFTPLMQGVRDQTAWVLLSAPREDGPVAGQKLCPRAPGRGLLVQGDAVEIQVAVEDPDQGTEQGTEQDGGKS
jgi:S-DNA-T family DNA segregation ATPase FtsK/SpoIIIE